MAIEIERKFLVIGEGWRSGVPHRITQGYLSEESGPTVRVRTCGAKAFLTIKGETIGISRPEFEYEIPLEDARALLAMCQTPLVEKTRWIVPAGTLKWEVDEFSGLNRGLNIAELELTAEDQVFEKPDWIGREVTSEKRYYNSKLARHPFCDWSDGEKQ